MRQKIQLLKNVASQYRKTIVQTICSAFTAATLRWFPAIARIKSLEIGEYPEEPAAIVNARLMEMRPIIIREAAFQFLLLWVIFFILLLPYFFKVVHNINLIRELKTFFQKTGSPV